MGVAIVLLSVGCGRIGYAPPEDGLIAHFPFDEDVSVTGVAEDARSGGPSARCTSGSCPSLTRGVFGNAASFDGTDALVLDPSALLETRRGFTVSLWVMAGPGVDTQTVISKPHDGDATNVNTWGIFVWSDGGIGFETWEASGGNMLNADADTVGSARWTHLAAVWNGTEKRLYADGVLQDAAAVGTEFDGSDVRIGNELDYGATVQYLSGAVDEVRIYDRALDDYEVDALAAR